MADYRDNPFTLVYDGAITENVEAAVAVSRVNRNMMNDRPKKDQVIKSIRVDTLGEEYPEPEKK